MKTSPKIAAAPLLALLLALAGAPAHPAPPGPPAREEGAASRGAAPGAASGDDAGTRLSRIEQAMWERNPRATPLLREWAAADPDDRVRERSVGALVLLRDAKAATIFLGRLDGDPSPAVRRAAAEAVGLLRVATSARHLEERLLKDPDALVRAECARAIGRIGAAPSAPKLLVSLVMDPSPEVRALSAEAAAALRSPDAPDLLRAVAMRDDSVLVRIYAVRALAAISPRPSASLFRAVWDGTVDPDLRLEAFRGLLIAEKGGAWERTGLSDADERVRFLAFQDWLARTLELRPVTVGPARASFVERLEGFLGDPVRGIRELAKDQLEALGYRIRPSGFGYAVER